MVPEPAYSLFATFNPCPFTPTGRALDSVFGTGLIVPFHEARADEEYVAWVEGCPLPFRYSLELGDGNAVALDGGVLNPL